MNKLKETAGDIEVKERLWCATEREVLKFAGREAEEFVKGEAHSDGQKDVTSAAKKKGYPCGLIRSLGRARRLELDAEISAQLSEYREKIGLSH